MKTTCVKTTRGDTDLNCYILFFIIPLEMLSIIIFFKKMFQGLSILLIFFCFFFLIQCHMKAQKRGKEQQLDIMNKQYKQLESRLDEILSRIAKETEEIKDLEEQLTEGENLGII